MLGKARKDGITKTAFGKKRICDTIVVSFNFLFRVYYDQLKPSVIGLVILILKLVM